MLLPIDESQLTLLQDMMHVQGFLDTTNGWRFFHPSRQ
jgi:hypothetical protein